VRSSARPDRITFATATSVSLADIVAIADGAPVALGPDVHASLVRAHTAATEIADATPTYGRSTGVGANRDTAVTDATEHGIKKVRIRTPEPSSQLRAAP
jgi:histidine ammonia-lyase